ncbi:hypothetical protein MSG28_012249 [Choristoneura fumiferana]|uniref:Uncharacterized protein n=1 Tax=Choristoneura fumiferana TaxID=7141 RepID=A0ACC0KCL5_CHOFU|nr:hypothetical protein MSG28_012249 [Choristoneura fumiferana]
MDAQKNQKKRPALGIEPRVGNAPVIPLVLRVSMGDGDRSPSGSDTALDPRDADASRPASPAPVQMPSTSLAAETCSQDDIQPELDTEILALLGDAPKSDIQFGKPTHKDLASRWQDILEKGLLKDVKEKILDSYLIPENCSLLVAPTLNPEVKVALAENMVKRDASLQAKQKQESIAIAALNQAIELIIAKENHTKILKPISDACRLLCDSHFNDTRTRRGFIISAINPELKDTLSETKRDKLLFGENVSEKLKSAKTIKKSAADLKQVRNDKSNIFNKNNFLKYNHNSTSNRLNWKTMPRKITPRANLPTGKPRQPQRAGTNLGSQRRETSERPTAAKGARRR